MKRLLTFVLSVFICIPLLVAQNITIKGKVTDSVRKTPLKGAKILYQGNNSGIKTDSKGRFLIENITPDAVLMVSMDRYVVRLVKLSGDPTVNIELERDRKFLEFSTDIAFFFNFHYGPDRTAKETKLNESQKLWVYN